MIHYQETSDIIENVPKPNNQEHIKQRPEIYEDRSYSPRQNNEYHETHEPESNHFCLPRRASGDARQRAAQAALAIVQPITILDLVN